MAGPRGLMGPIGARAAGPRPGPRSQAKAVVQVPSWGGDGDGRGALSPRDTSGRVHASSLFHCWRGKNISADTTGAKAVTACHGV